MTNGQTNAGAVNTPLGKGSGSISFTDHLTSKNMSEKSTKEVSTFIVATSNDFIKSDWFSNDAFKDISNGLLSQASFSYTLKAMAMPKGFNEGRDGKAVKVTRYEGFIEFCIYTMSFQSKSSEWIVSHRYQIDPIIFNAYSIVVNNIFNMDILETADRKAKKSNLILV